MKKTITLFATLIAFTFVLISCGGGEKSPEAGDQQTPAVNVVLDNLIAAFQGESNASNKYKMFAEAADKEGYAQAAVLFRAASRAEAIHAENHLKIIQQMGGTAEPKLDPVEVKTTKENLQAALDGETYEFTTMYPEFIANAKKERSMDAIGTFNFAMEAEKGHAGLYTDAIKNLENMKKVTGVYYVCPVCGETFAQKQSAPCPICATSNEKFIEIK
jgi:rubrerythrin